MGNASTKPANPAFSTNTRDVITFRIRQSRFRIFPVQFVLETRMHGDAGW